MSRLAFAACLVAVTALGVHLAAAAGGAYLNHVSGAWLALAADLADGEFYRPVESATGYGGTRYFPLFFAIIALFIRTGMTPLVAGAVTIALAGAVLAAGVFHLVRVRGGSVPLALTFAAAALSPYFLQQTMFEIRADVLAAALAVAGLATIGADRDPSPGPAWIPGVLLALAAATKITIVPVVLAVAAGIAASGRTRFAVSVLAWWVAWAGTIAIVVHVTSGGRALENWQAVMLAGQSAGGIFDGLTSGAFLEATRYSRLLQVLMLISAGSIAAAVWAGRSRGLAALGWIVVPAAALAGASIAAGYVLSSPGAVASNHMVEWIAVAIAVIGWVAGAEPRLARPLGGIAVALVAGMSVQDLIRAREIAHWQDIGRTPAAVQALVGRVADQPEPVLSDSALWPVLAGRRAHVLDPYGLRVLAQRRPAIETALVADITAQKFPLVILQQDPGTPVGRAYYEHVHFGARIRDAILSAYRLDSQPLGDAFVFVPRQP